MNSLTFYPIHGDFPIFLSERHSVEYMSEPSIISSQYKFYAFIFIFDIGKTLVERLDTFYSRTDIFSGLVISFMETPNA